MSTVLKVLPLLVVLVLLMPPFKFHILVAGFAGGVIAALIGGLTIAKVTSVYLSGLSQMMGITSVMVFAATAIFLSQAGATKALLGLIERLFKGKLAYVAAGMVLVQALATYAAGCGAANTLVTAPLIANLVGFVPHVVAGLSIVSGASWATSPSSAESAFISKAMNISVTEYAEFMRPYTVIFWIVGMLLAWYGVKRYGSRLGKDHHNQEKEEVPLGTQLRHALPFLVLLTLILVGPPINRALNKSLFTTVTTPLITVIVACLSMRLNPNQVGEMLIDGARPILRYLFLVGLFLGFIKIMGEIGTFDALASLPGLMPVGLITAGALVIAFLIAIPSAAYTVAIDALIIPVMAAVGVPIWAFGFVGIAVAQGAMISPVQINVAATAHGFGVDIMQVVKNNIKYMVLIMILTVSFGVFVTLR
ncbi:MAG: hypothetical protein AB1445_05220 [Bacillota bacterium]